MKTIIKTRDDEGRVIGSFEFDSSTWVPIGGDGTGSVGHYSQQGDRTLYASPRKSAKIGRHRFVLFGTGYYAAIDGGGMGNGGLDWGTKAFEVSDDDALSIMDDEHIATYSSEPENLDA